MSTPHIVRRALTACALAVCLAAPALAQVYTTTRDPQTGRLVRAEASATRAQQAQTFTGEVVGISDGDTIEVLRDGRAVKVRLHGVDTPEKAQAFGTRARQFTADLVHRHTITVQVRDTDRYGRLVAEVLLSDGRSLNRELVRAGMAWWYRQYAPGDTELARLEADARESQRGLWSDPHAVTPWDFRHPEGRSNTTATSTTPADNGARTIHTGPRGGKFYYSENGNKVYIPR